jgi:S1-C subfamily serine protease
MVTVFALAGSVLSLATPVSSVQKPPFSMVNLRSVQEQIQLEQAARLITVRILSSPKQKRDRSLGSGVLFYQDKLTSTYGVITNNHVLQAGEAPYSIQTPDGKIHRANPVVQKKQLRGEMI